jgi:hypothetical protein
MATRAKSVGRLEILIGMTAAADDIGVLALENESGLLMVEDLFNPGCRGVTGLTVGASIVVRESRLMWILLSVTTLARDRLESEPQTLILPTVAALAWS